MFPKVREYIDKVAPLDDEDWNTLLMFFDYEESPRHEILLNEGMVARKMYFIVEGLVRIYFLQDGKEINRQFFFENTFFTEFESFTLQKPTRFFVETVEPTKLLAIQHHHLETLYSKSISLLRFGKKMAEIAMLRNMQRTMDMMTLPAIEQYKKLVSQRPKVHERIPLKTIASYLGITPEALSRIRRDIAKETL